MFFLIDIILHKYNWFYRFVLNLNLSLPAKWITSAIFVWICTSNDETSTAEQRSWSRLHPLATTDNTPNHSQSTYAPDELDIIHCCLRFMLAFSWINTDIMIPWPCLLFSGRIAGKQAGLFSIHIFARRYLRKFQCSVLIFYFCSSLWYVPLAVWLITTEKQLTLSNNQTWSQRDVIQLKLNFNKI